MKRRRKGAAVRDPLRWQAGDGPMADWLTWIDEQLVGPQPDGYRLWGPGDYPQVVGTGYDPAGLAAWFTAAGVTTLSVRTSRHEERGRPGVVVLKPPADRFDATVVRAEPVGTPVGRIPVTARVRTPAELGHWLADWSPLVAGGFPGFHWTDDPLAAPLSVTHEHVDSGARLVLHDLAALEQNGPHGSERLAVVLGPDPEAQALLLGHPVLLEQRRTTAVSVLRTWLTELAEVWDAADLPTLGLWAGAAALPGTTRAQVSLLEPDRVTLTLHREKQLPLTLDGAPSELAAWALPLLTPAVHFPVLISSSGRRLARRLAEIEHAVCGGPAQWTYGEPEEVLTTAELTARLTADCPGQYASVARVTGTTVVLGRVRIGGGWPEGRWIETTGRPVGAAG